jgi:hypothetical protein
MPELGTGPLAPKKTLPGLTLAKGPSLPNANTVPGSFQLNVKVFDKAPINEPERGSAVAGRSAQGGG